MNPEGHGDSVAAERSEEGRTAEDVLEDVLAQANCNSPSAHYRHRHEPDHRCRRLGRLDATTALAALAQHGYAVVRVGEVPDWMERAETVDEAGERWAAWLCGEDWCGGVHWFDPAYKASGIALYRITERSEAQG